MINTAGRKYLTNFLIFTNNNSGKEIKSLSDNNTGEHQKTYLLTIYTRTYNKHVSATGQVFNTDQTVQRNSKLSAMTTVIQFRLIVTAGFAPNSGFHSSNK